ncbi:MULTISPECIES: DNA repair protein RadC [unclassified Oceanobacillus]|uniref:RadC family protein n=1 Tax=unclassified Oceanobacillus TaxID=2630292 RepID=UPI001BEBE500|nr:MULTISPECIES: DNA repair protein RadC [unclassified Oceanobacillus]MBT2598186.1 DNA repair protein RadC [Oceanobacillus sp. ISL-74]MBT2651105.1 DNA repair protein RadC [Oceanobacillus sp. ISL-73]
MKKTSVLTMKSVPKEDRPRERLLKHGASHLSNQEILSILIGSGTKQDSVNVLSNRILMHFEGMKLLRDATIEELIAIKGIGTAKGLIILAAIELGKRLNAYKPDGPYVIRSPEDGANYVMEEMRYLSQEHFVVLFLNTKNQIIHYQTVFIGSLNASIVHPREVFKEAVKRSAASLIVAHNHPSGVRLQGVSI